MDVDQALRTLEIVASWPVILLIVLLIFRGELITAGKWLGGQMGKREGSIETPFGGVRFGKPITETVGAPADRIARARVAMEMDEATETVEAETDWASIPELHRPEAEALRIAERVKLLLAEAPSYLDRRSGVTEMELYEDVSEDSVFDRVKVTSRAHEALAWLRFSEPRALSGSYAVWVRAAEILTDDGIQIPVPPFTQEEFHNLAIAQFVG